MRTVYNILIYIASFILRGLAVFNLKIRLGVNGRKRTFKLLNQYLHKTDAKIWFHCASLGEYEQGFPVFEAIKNEFPNHQIILSFISPSGYEIKKDSSIADIVVYMPLDTKANAKRFLNLVNPECIVFVKFEIWPNMLLEIKLRQIQCILISALFKKEQAVFTFYGNLLKKSLCAFQHIFVQNQSSKQLLNQINYTDVTISGDTRFDRVYNQLKVNNSLKSIETFKDNTLCLVAGSTWPEDEKLLTHYINSTSTKIKVIIAPHKIATSRIQKLKKHILKPTAILSQIDSKQLNNFDVLIIDSIGILSKVYYYADLAYIGGALGKTGLHNTLEAAVFGIPIIIGPHHKKFPEAKAMIDQGGMFVASNQEEFNAILNHFTKNTDERKTTGKINKLYITNNQGAVTKIINFVRKIK